MPQPLGPTPEPEQSWMILAIIVLGLLFLLLGGYDAAHPL